MADLLSHVLIVYVLLTLVSWRLEWLGRRWVVVGMGGAFIPDLSKVRLLVDSAVVEELFGVPFTFQHLSTLGGVVLAAGIITLLFERDCWGRVYGLLVVGGSSHLVVDGLRVWADSRASQWVFPLVPSWRPPTPNLYVSSDPTVPLVVLSVSVAVFLVDRRYAQADG